MNANILGKLDSLPRLIKYIYFFYKNESENEFLQPLPSCWTGSFIFVSMAQQILISIASSAFAITASQACLFLLTSILTFKQLFIAFMGCYNNENNKLFTPGK